MHLKTPDAAQRLEFTSLALEQVSNQEIIQLASRQREEHERVDKPY